MSAHRATPCDAGQSCGRVGIDAIEQVCLMENHDRAYLLWRDAGVKDRILVHVDAHHDMWWIENNGSITIANFICPALREGMIREVYWVVPDETWDNPHARKALRQHLKRILKTYPGTSAARWEKRSVRAEVLGRPLVICPIDSLPAFSGNVLLDIDIDYLVIPKVSYGCTDTHTKVPWRSPANLLERLKARSLTTDFVTIVYSVEGGYTPFAWKYLGDEVAMRMRSPAGGTEGLAACETMWSGLESRINGDLSAAEEKFRAVGDPLRGAAHFQLAYMLAGEGRIEQSRVDYEHALALDASCREADANPGLLLYRKGEYTDADRAFRRTLTLDSSDRYAHLGLGVLAARRKQWATAEEEFRSVLKVWPDSIDALRGLAQALEKQGRGDKALPIYEESLRLAMAGRKPLGRLIATDPDSARLLDGDHGRIHACVARIYARTQKSRALAGYRIAIGTGYDVAWVRFRVAWLYAQEGQWRNACEHAAKGIAKMPDAIRLKMHRMRSRLALSISREKSDLQLSRV